MREVVEAVAFAARREKKIDRRSGVSQRLPISALENAVSATPSAGRSSPARTRWCRGSRDIYAALPSLTGKFELEYEGELLGAENVARELIREAVGEVFSTYLGAADFRQVVRFFEEGGTLRIREGSPSADVLAQLKRVPDVLEHLQPLGVEPGASRRSRRPRASSCSRACGRRRRSAAATTAASWRPSGAPRSRSTSSASSGCAGSRSR